MSDIFNKLLIETMQRKNILVFLHDFLIDVDSFRDWCIYILGRMLMTYKVGYFLYK